MPDKAILIRFRFSAEIKSVPITLSAHSNGGFKFLITRIIPLKHIIPRSTSATER